MTVAVDAEITALMLCLQRQRNHVLGTVEGLSDEALRRPVLPSGWNCLGMVQHLTLSVERLLFPCRCGWGSGGHRHDRQPRQRMAGGSRAAGRRATRRSWPSLQCSTP